MASVHRQTLVNLVRSNGWTSGVELGVDKGILFRMLLEGCSNLHLTGVDLFPDMERSRRVRATAELYADRAQVLRMSTVEAAQLFQDNSLDFVFIDADHSYDGVMQDIAAWQPKVKPGGWLGGSEIAVQESRGYQIERMCAVRGHLSELLDSALEAVACCLRLALPNEKTGCVDVGAGGKSGLTGCKGQINATLVSR